MYLTINEVLQSEGESVQRPWLLTRCLEEKVAAVVNMVVRAVTSDALCELGLSVRTLVGKIEAKLSAVNPACETWPSRCDMWAPKIVGPQIESVPAMACVPPSVNILLEAVG